MQCNNICKSCNDWDICQRRKHYANWQIAEKDRVIMYAINVIQCSQCGYERLWSDSSRYCPKCGSYMTGVNHE